MDKRTFLEDLVQKAIMDQGFKIQMSDGLDDERLVISAMATSLQKCLDDYLIINKADVIR